MLVERGSKAITRDGTLVDVVLVVHRTADADHVLAYDKSRKLGDRYVLVDVTAVRA